MTLLLIDAIMYLLDTRISNIVMRTMQMQAVLAVLQKIEPSLNEIKVTRKEAASKYTELLKVLKNRTRSSDYMIQFVKSPLCTPPLICNCKARAQGLFQPLRMPISTYEELHTMLFPLPTPQGKPRDDTGDLHYMTLEENLSMPYTYEYQPSKMSKNAASANRNTLASSTLSSRIGVGRSRGRDHDPFLFESLKSKT
jgi:hypothetical protein